MTSGALDVTANSNMAAPLLAKSFGRLLFAVISAIAFTTVLGTVSGLIMAASGAVAHDLMTNFLKLKMNDHAKVRAGKVAAVVVGAAAMVLGIVFKDLNVGFPGRLGIQRRGIRKSAVPDHASLLEPHHQAGHHRRDHRSA